MDKILRFLYNHIEFIFFLILELLAFLLVINKNDLQQSVAFKVGTNIAAYSYRVTTSISDYFGLKEVNEQLANENAELREQMSNLKGQIRTLKDTVAVNLPHVDYVDYITAKVVYNSVYNLQNYIIVDKGRKHGITEDMGVISPQGVVGVVARTSEKFSVILPLINPDLIVSARIKDSKQLGSVVWDGLTPLKAKLNEIPSHVNPIAGDSVITSGFSAIFPEGMFIGTIDKAIHHEHAMFCDVDITLAVDFQSLSYVTITAYKYKQELSDLQNEMEDGK